jgi:hypothetical protein
MDINRLTQLALQINPPGKRDTGRPNRRLREMDYLNEKRVTQDRNNSPKPTMFMMMMIINYLS